MKHYLITEKVELPTGKLADVFVRGIADAMGVTVEDAEKIFQLKK